MANVRISSWLVLATCAAIFSSALGRYDRRQSDLPVVDLGYEVHQGSVNITGDYYLFSNIPYAKQPIDDLRFRKPVAIEDSDSGGNDGIGDGEVVMCPQAYPQWVINLMAERNGVDNETMAALLNSQAGQTESCLVLDVYVPEDIFSQAPVADAPVLVWIHGGRFTFGSKTLYGSPAGLIARSRRNKEDGIIVVSINYRLGMFGWLAGDDVTPNLGLYDQRLALEWVKQYIALFGGSADKVTAMGESAGASSIVHHITAYGGEERAPFQAAIPQSPAFQFNIDLAAGYEKTLDEASKQTGKTVDKVDDLRKLSANTLSAINQATVTSSPIGTFGFGPGPDGSFVPDIPQVLLYQGKFDSSVNLMISHTSNESVVFTPPSISSDDDVRSYVRSSLPGASDDTINTLLTDPGLYPDILDDVTVYPWETEFGRATRLATDLGFACMTRYLSAARGNETFNYLFAFPPGWHAGDVPYVFFNGDTTTLNNGYPVDATLATQLQDYIVAFARTGDPNAGGVGPTPFPEYGDESRVLELGYGGWREREDDLTGGRCEWLQKAMVDGKL
ncbi:alpha/beta-hydrolase [Hypomontagnella submonticulosa]|nr:alpha/beta-hydrolase [Hypomontagnella submonticulosa]